ncbi:MAG: cytochrome c oxidase assembly protein [Chloroflexota bacterium]|nr:cytochrome c oxidase assembly protein [Chloroflexota bacterium]MDE3101325.1 cytochrome c oxidase assembly protein [Chloroflexota bacterium]
MNLVLAISFGLIAALYLDGAQSSRPGGHPWPAWRSALFFMGLAAIGAALLSPIDALASQLFSVHMIQHMLLMSIAAPLLLLGAPVRPLLRGLPRWSRVHLVRPIARSGALRGLLHILRHPLVAGALFLGGLYAWHAPPAYEAALLDQKVHDIEHLWFLVTALLFWSCVIDPEPFHATLGYGMRIPYLAIVGAGQSLLGALLALSSRPFYPTYTLTAAALGVDALTDQRVGGSIMWAPGDIIVFVAASIVFFQWLDHEERDQLERERKARVGASRPAGASR